MGSLFPKRAESQSESHLDKTPHNKALVQIVQRGCSVAAVAWNVERATWQGTNQLRHWAVVASESLYTVAVLARSIKALP